MATYTVKPGQNLFDVALHLYGSIEGLFDLLISNSELNMTTDLTTGMELTYHDYFVINESIVETYEEDNIIPANSERNVYHKSTDETLRFFVKVDDDFTSIGMIVGGEGDMVIDWGDNSDLETITLSHTNKTLEHYFNSEVESRRVKVYGNFQLTYFDASNLGGEFFLMEPMTVDEFYSKANGYSLDSLFLFEGTYAVSLPSCSVASLLPLGNMELMTLDLRTTKFVPDNSVVDEYLAYVVANYGTRRNCTVYLDELPGATGIAAIETILGEEEWNANGEWQFIIAGENYTI